MRLVPSDQRQAISAVRLALSLAVTAVVPLLLYAAPVWWAQRNVLVQNATLEDYAPVNQGQLKNIARAAAAEMDAQLIGGAGDEIHGLVNSWTAPHPETNDFAPVNLGQLKNIAKPFYDRLISAGIIDSYPWLSSANSPDDFAIASIGQVKNLFSFEIPAPNSVQLPWADRVTGGQFSACLALAPNATWLWRDQSSNAGQLNSDYPHRVTGLPPVASVSAGERYLAILAADGTVWTWGDNAVGQLGDGTNINRSIPGAVPNLTNIISVEAGGSHVLALQSDGSVVAWGDNSYGQLGTGDTTSSSTPKVIPALTQIRRIAAGFLRSAALTNDGIVWTWGYRYYNNQDIFTINPVAVPELSDVVDIAAGYEHMVAVKSDGSVWAWGSNYANQVANGNPWWKFQDVPFQVPNLPPIAKVASKYDHTLAIATDGTLWSWGYNFDGQLGDGTTEARQTPVKVIGLTDVIAIATANTYSLAMKSDGTVWAWGDGAAGILPGSDRHVPQQVGLGLLDSNHNGMDDRWEIHNFGNLGQSPDADFDGDGISNLREYLMGTNPKGYYNGVPPVIEVAGGNNQVGEPSTFLAKPFKVRVRNSQGQALVNAPVTFSLTSEGGGLSTTIGGAPQLTVPVRTDLNGEAYVYHLLPDTGGISSRTVVTAGDDVPLASAAFRGIARLSPPPQPTPIPDPNPSPSPTPDPSATPSPTPVAPYRYAIIDLGKDVYPSRLNNKGVILFEGPDAKGNWGFCRWKSGVVEGLKPATADRFFKAADLNDDGTVVGWEERLDDPVLWFVLNQVNDFSSGLIWSSSSSVPRVLSSAPIANWAISWPGLIRQAYLSAISNRNAVTNQIDLYGAVYLGEGPYAWWDFLDFHQILNAQRWNEDLSARTQLSFSSSTVTWANPFPIINWHGPMDRVTRANSSGRYIGSRLIPRAGSTFPPASVASMVDGQTVNFDAVDINESGTVVGSNGAGMIIRIPGQSDLVFAGSSALAINDHTRPAPTPVPQQSPTATPQPTPIPAPQVLSWTGNALALWELQPDGKTWHPFGLEEMIPSMDGWDGLNPSDMNDNGLIVGTAWYTDPSNPAARAELHGVMLVPCEVMVDANRDGEMSFDDPVIHDADQTSEDKPYRFWVNDDQDNVGIGTVPTTYGDGETISAATPDFSQATILTPRDLEDWTRIWISFQHVQDIVKDPLNEIEVRLLRSEGPAPLIKVCVAFEPRGGWSYLTDAATATAQIASPFSKTYGPIGTTAFNLKSIADVDWANGLASTDGTLHLLFEGAAEGKGILQVRIKRNSQVLVQYPDLFLDIKKVRRMYERGKITVEAPDIPDPWDNPQPPALQWTWDPWQWPPDVYATSDDAIIFVHGWRMTYAEYLTWADTTFKRLYRLGYKGRFYAFHWPTFNGENNGFNPVDLFVPGGTTYNPSEYRAWLSGPALRDFVNSLPGSNKYLVAHSMGNVVAGSALRTGMQITRYAMCNAAIAAMAYDQNIVDFNYETPDTDSDEATRSTFGLANKLNPSGTKLINFGLPADYALGQWNANNQFFKPQPRIPANYYYRPLNSRGRKLTYEGLVSVRVVTSVAEAIGYVTQSRSAAEGTKQSTSGSINAVVNMGSGGFDFGTEHSAEWEFNMQRTYPFWREILHQFDLSVPSQPLP